MTDNEIIPVIRQADLDAHLEHPIVRERMERIRRMSESKVSFIKEIAPNTFVINPHLGRRANMHIAEDDDSA